MRTFFPSESSKESQLNALNPQSWLQVERGKLSRLPSNSSPSSIESLIKVPEPPILPFYKPVDYVEVFRGLGEVKLMRRSLRAAWQKASSIHEKLIFGAWLKYEKQGEEHISDLLACCHKCAQEFGPVDILTQLPIDATVSSTRENISLNGNGIPRNVSFRIQDEKVDCDRQKISSLGITSRGHRFVAKQYQCIRNLHPWCLQYALEENCPVLAASCLQVSLNDRPDCLNDNRVVDIFRHADRQQRSIMVGQASFSLYCLLSEVCMNLDPQSDKTACFLERLVEFSENDRQRMLAFHQLGCLRLLRKEYDEAKRLFEEALNAGHIYSVAGLARLSYIKIISNRRVWRTRRSKIA
ncbi:hypothetical protein ACFX19_031629 [Malus domestica]